MLLPLVCPRLQENMRGNFFIHCKVIALLQRIIEAREAAHARGAGGSGLMVPLLSSAHEWRQPLRARAMDLPAFGQGASGDAHHEATGEAERGHRGSGEQGDVRERVMYHPMLE